VRLGGDGASVFNFNDAGGQGWATWRRDWTLKLAALS